MLTQIEREEQQLEDDLNEGRITRKQYNEAMRDLQRAEHDARRERAQNVYDREMDEW